MDDIVCGDGGVNGNPTSEDKCFESCINESLTKAFDSPKERKSRSSSNESVYEVIAELSNEESENESISDDEDIYKHCSSLLNSMDSDDKMSQKQDRTSASVEIDEEFVIVEDDANDIPEDKIESRKLTNIEQPCLINCDGIKTTEGQEEEISGFRLSEKEDIKKSASGELAPAQSKKYITAVLSSEDDDGMDEVLEEFRKIDFEDNLSVENRGGDLKSKIVPTFINEKAEDCIIAYDNEEKSNFSDSSSIEILNDDDDDSMSKTDNSLMCKANEQMHAVNSKVHRSLSFNSSEGDKSDLGNMILDIVDEAIPGKIVGDVSISKSNQNTVLNSATSKNILESSSEHKFDKCNVTSESEVVPFCLLTKNPVKNVYNCIEENIINSGAVNNYNKENDVSKSIYASSDLLNSADLKEDTHSELDLKCASSQTPTVNISEAETSLECDIKSFSEKTPTVAVLKSEEKDAHFESDFEMLSAEKISKSVKEHTFSKPDLKTLSAENIVKSETDKAFLELDIKIASTEMTKIDISECDKEEAHSESGTVKIVSSDAKISKVEMSDETDSFSSNGFSAELSMIGIAECAKEKDSTKSNVKHISTEVVLSKSSRGNEDSEFDLKSVPAERSTVEMSDNLLEKANSESGIMHISSDISTLPMPESLKDENSERSSEISTLEMTESLKEDANSEMDIKHILEEIGMVKTSDNLQEKSSTESDSDERCISAEMSAVAMSDSLNENEISESAVSNISSEIATVEIQESLQEKVNSESHMKHISPEISMVEMSENLKEEANTESNIKHVCDEMSENMKEKTNSDADEINKCSDDLCEKEKEEILQSSPSNSIVEMEIDESESVQSHEVEINTKAIELENRSNTIVLQTSQMETVEAEVTVLKAEGHKENKKDELDKTEDEIQTEKKCIDESQAENPTHAKNSNTGLKWTVESEPVILNSSDNEIKSNSDCVVKRKSKDAVKRKSKDPSLNDKIKKLKTYIEEENKENSTVLSGNEALDSGLEMKENDSIQLKSNTSSLEDQVMEELGLNEDMYFTCEELDELVENSMKAVFKKHHAKEHAELVKYAEELKETVETVSAQYQNLRVEYFALREAQKAAFDAYNYSPRVNTRTVGINVKIYKESHFQQALKLERSKNTTPKVEEPEPKHATPTENAKKESVPFEELKKEKVGSKMKVRKVSKTIKTASKKQHILKTGKSHIKRKLVKRDQSVNKVSVSNQEDMSYSDISEKPNSHLNMTYGFIGISTLKLRRAVLLKLINSFEIVFWDPVMVNKMKRGKNIKKIKRANSPAQLIKSCDVTFCCYGSDADDFLEILNGENGILAGFRVAERLRRKRGFVHLAFSLDSKYSEIIDKGAKKKDCVYLEALISQSYGKTFIDASGDINLFKNCEKCFELIASECSFLGKILGAASAKNNISLAFSGMLSNILAEGALLFHKLIPNTPKSNVTAILTALIENRFLNTVLDSKEESEEDNMRIKHLQENLEAVVNETAKLDLNMSIAAASNDYLHGIQLNYSDE